MAEESKILGGQCDAPRRAQDSGYVLKALYKDTFFREQIDKSTLFAAIVIGPGLCRVLLGISYNQVLPNRPEHCRAQIPLGQPWSLKVPPGTLSALKFVSYTSIVPLAKFAAIRKWFPSLLG